MARKTDTKFAEKGIWNNNYFIRDKNPDCVFVHIMCANKWSATTCGNYFARSKVSSNYGIGYNGDIVQYVEEKYGAWAQGSRYWNKRGISIELANSTGAAKGWEVSFDTLESCIELVADIFIRNNLGHVNYTGTTRGNLLMHKWVANTACPGVYVSTKFPHIAEEANKIIDGKIRLPERGYFIEGDYGRSVRNLKKWLKANGFRPTLIISRNYGSGTAKAVKKFQKKYGLTVDGEWGNECMRVYKTLK